MASGLDILDSLLQNGMKKSSAGRLEHSLSAKGIGGPGGFLEEILGAARAQSTSPSAHVPTPAGKSSAAADGGIGDILGSILGGSKNWKTGVLGALAGAILGGGSKSAGGALKGGALAVLGAIALQALRAASNKQSGSPQLDRAANLAAGLRLPENDQEVQHLESVSQLIAKAMVNAAKADGRVDEVELNRILGNAEKDGVNAHAREFLGAELRKPMDTDGLVREVSSPQVATQVYAASLLAIELDTPQEQQYMSELARKLSLDSEVVRRVHMTVGLS